VKTKAKAKAEPTRQVCDSVDQREQFLCARCGKSIDGGSRHHRQLRRFGDHSTANLILLCGSGTTGCHGWVHSHVQRSYELGYLVHSWHLPENVPVRVFAPDLGAAWVLHDREGRRMMISDRDALSTLVSLDIIGS
jgi:hypothetical protein